MSLLPLYTKKRRGAYLGGQQKQHQEEAEELEIPGQGWAKQLCNVSELPEWYEAYPSVRNFYRVNYSACDCALSLIEIHNESCNIWSHLVGFVIFLHQTVASCRSLRNEFDGNELSRLAFTACATAMLGASATYHAFYPVSKRTLHALLTVDKLGIALMLGGSFIPGVWLGFRRSPAVVRFAWLADAMFITSIAVFLAYKRSTNRFKAVVVCLVCSTLAPAVHWAVTAPAPDLLLLLPKLSTMFGLYGLGFLFYVTRWPEKNHPGLVDLFGASHQLWHVCILAAALVWLSDIDDCLAKIRREESDPVLPHSLGEFGG